MECQREQTIASSDRWKGHLIRTDSNNHRNEATSIVFARSHKTNLAQSSLQSGTMNNLEEFDFSSYFLTDICS